MARKGRRRLRPTPWALTIAAWDIWRRLPPAQRRQLVRAARKHGPRIAAGVPLRFVGRPWRASPSEGYPTAHLVEQDRIARAALE